MIHAELKSLPNEDICISLMWLLLMGITFTLVPVIVKTSAINRLIQSSKKSQRVNISRRVLFGQVLFCALGVAGFMVAWTVLDTPYGQVTQRLDPEDPTIIVADLRCGSNYYYWKIAAYAWEVMLLVLAAVLAFQSRGVLSQFNESKSLGIMVYSHFMFLILRGVTQVFFYLPSLNFAIVSAILSMNYSIDSCKCHFLYLPPLSA